MNTRSMLNIRPAATLVAVFALVLSALLPVASLRAEPRSLAAHPVDAGNTTIGQDQPGTGDYRYDLGDAPDSTNHFGAAMGAYAGIMARYPTVFDLATGAPPGPLHTTPLPFHLGQQVSLEQEADVGPDQDPSNNIRPPANVSNQDRFDDGTIFGNWRLRHCERTRVPVSVFINANAVNWFKAKERPGYLNIWLDSNRDGDWEDGFTCVSPSGAGQVALEHIAIDVPVNVVGLGVGQHIVQVPTGAIYWPANLQSYNRWVRITLSERPSPKSHQFAGIAYTDGRGHNTPYKLGETEDSRTAFPIPTTAD